MLPIRDLILLILALSLPAAGFFLLHDAGSAPNSTELISGGSKFPASELKFQKSRIGAPPGYPPRIANVQIVDFDGDGRNDVLCCDALQGRVVVYRQVEPGKWNESIVGQNLRFPAHAEIVDLDGDGDKDVIVAVLGNIRPDDGVVGSVVWLEQKSGSTFVPHVILTDVRRVADVQPGDFDGDGDVDIAVAVFGYARGEILWLENRGNGHFREHKLMSAPGTIHVPVADYDKDGDLDIVAIVTQNEEELWAFENDGKGRFKPRRLWFTHNFDLGGAGLVRTDLDADGDDDLLMAAGDNLEYEHTYPQPYHGCFWFENKGQWKFEPHRISNLGGTYAAASGDIDGDGDLDVALVSMFNEWGRDGMASVVWLENDGRQQFKTWQIDDRPIRLATVACGDVNGDGRSDIVAGGLHFIDAVKRTAGISAWIVTPKETP